MDRRSGPTMLELLSMGGTAGGCIAVGVGVGYWIGSAVHAETVAVFSGLALGVVAAVLTAYIKIKRYL